MTREVYLPASCDWFDFWTSARLTGGQRITAAAPLDRIPVYVPAGSIIAMGDDKEWHNQSPDDALELRIYPGRDATFTLHEDTGNGYGYERGEKTAIRFDWQDDSSTLSIAAREGAFPGMLQQREFHVVLVGEAHGAGAAKSMPDQILKYDGTAQSVTLATAK